jgi:Leucine rich repeat
VVSFIETPFSLFLSAKLTIVISLDSNSLSAIPAGSISQFSSLMYLYMANNQIATVDPDTHALWGSLLVLSMLNNPSQCFLTLPLNPAVFRNYVSTAQRVSLAVYCDCAPGTRCISTTTMTLLIHPGTRCLFTLVLRAYPPWYSVLIHHGRLCRLRLLRRREFGLCKSSWYDYSVHVNDHLQPTPHKRLLRHQRHHSLPVDPE